MRVQKMSEFVFSDIFILDIDVGFILIKISQLRRNVMGYHMNRYGCIMEESGWVRSF